MSSEMSDKRREVARRLREYPVHLALGMEGGSLIRALAMLSGTQAGRSGVALRTARRPDRPDVRKQSDCH